MYFVFTVFAVVIYGATICYLWRSFLHPIVWVLYGVSLGVWYILPALFNLVLLASGRGVMDFGLGPQFVTYYGICLIGNVGIGSIAVSLSAFVRGKMKRIRPIHREISDWSMLSLVSGFSLVYFYLRYASSVQDYFAFSYLERNSLTMLGTISGNRIDALFATLETMFLVPVLVAGVLMDKVHRSGFLYNLARGIALLMLGFITVENVLYGSRIFILLPFLLLLLKMTMSFKGFELKRLVLFGAIAAVSFVPVMKISNAIADLRSQRAAFTLDTIGHSLQMVSVSEALQGYNNKFDSPAYGAIFMMSRVEGENTLTPYVGAVFSMVPRAFWPQKSVPGSIDGTMRGHPSRVAASFIEGRSGAELDILNVTTTPLSNSYFFLGGWGVGLNLFIAAVYGVVVFTWILNGSRLSLIIVFYLVGLPVAGRVYPPDFEAIVWLQRAVFFFAFGLLMMKVFPKLTALPELRLARGGKV